jgi:two-component system chemotaxis response regulator CheY
MAIDPRKPLEFATLSLLLAEDEPFARRLTLATLQRIGIRNVVAVENGTDALGAIAAARAPFHLILSDWNMPGMNGLELLRLVREEHAHMAFLMLTGHADQELVMAARAARVNGYIVKPFSTDQLRSKIAVTLGIKG